MSEETTSSEVRQLTYQETLCLQMLRYGAVGEYTGDMKPSEIKEKLEPFFPREMMEDMINLFHGNVEFILFSIPNS